MLDHIRRSIVLSVICLVFFGFVYMFAGTGVAQLLFKHQADGSIRANGSTEIGQPWTSPKWFHGRPDDFGPYAYTKKTKVVGGDDPLQRTGVTHESGATNLGPRSKVLLADTKQLVAWWHKEGVTPTPDLVTTSGSGLTANITPEDATVQIPMITRATGVPRATLEQLISRYTHSHELGFLGSSYIIVLTLNQGLRALELSH
jgi:K+-transporting ATPase ATPase C chain